MARLQLGAVGAGQRPARRAILAPRVFQALGEAGFSRRLILAQKPLQIAGECQIGLREGRCRAVINLALQGIQGRQARTRHRGASFSHLGFERIQP